MTNKVKAVTATWCQPCKNLKPYINELAKTYDITMVDIDETPGVVPKYDIMGVPTIILERPVDAEGRGDYDLLFNPSPRELKEAIEKHMA